MFSPVRQPFPLLAVQTCGRWPVLLRLRFHHLVPVLALCCVTQLALAQTDTLLVAQTSAQACPPGWDQLLSPDERKRERKARGCDTADRSATLAAGQLDVYSRPLTLGPSGALAAPASSGGPRKASRRAPSAGSLAAVSAHEPLLAMPMPASVAHGGGGRPAALAPLIDHTARSHDIDPLLLHAIARVESRHRPGAVSHAGAHGLMQVIVPTASRFGVDSARALHDPQTNLHVSARYLKTLQRRFGNDLRLVLAAYNAGEGAVEKHGRRIPPYRETQDYVRKVLSEYALLRRVSRRGEASVVGKEAAL